MAGLRPGQILAGYELSSRLGVGPVCEVWKATEAFTDEVVALKIARVPGARAALARSATIHGHLPENAAVPLIEVNLQATPPFIARRLIRGPSIARILRKDGRLSQSRAAALLRAVAERLAVAHAQGIPHLDLKPENIFWERGETVRLTDFGCTANSPMYPSAQHDIDALAEVWRKLGRPDPEIEALLEGPDCARDAPDLLRRLDHELSERRRLSVRVRRMLARPRRKRSAGQVASGRAATGRAATADAAHAALSVHRYAWAATLSALLAVSVVLGSAVVRAARLRAEPDEEAHAAARASERRGHWPTPTQPQTARGGRSSLSGGARVTELRLGGDHPLVDARWSHAGGEVLTLNRDGVLRRISIVDGVEGTRLQLPGAGRGLALGPRRLYAATSGGVWTIKPTALKPTAFGRMRGIAAIAAGAAGQLYAYVPRSATLFSLSGQTGRVYARTPLRSVGPKDGPPLRAERDPQGKSLVLRFSARSVRLELTRQGVREHSSFPRSEENAGAAISAYDRRFRRSLRLERNQLSIYRQGVLRRRIRLPGRGVPRRLEVRRDGVWALALTEDALYVVRLLAPETRRSSGR